MALSKGDSNSNSAYEIKVLYMFSMCISEIFCGKNCTLLITLLEFRKIFSHNKVVCGYVPFQVELLAAKNLIGANLNGTSDPYAIITCGTEKRFRLFDLLLPMQLSSK